MRIFKLLIPKLRRKKKKKYKPNLVPGDLEVKRLVYRRNGFKRKLGAVIGIFGGILCFIPEPSLQIIGQGIVALGGGTTIIGGLDALKKNRQKEDDTYVDNSATLRMIADIVIWLIGKFLTKKGDPK